MNTPEDKFETSWEPIDGWHFWLYHKLPGDVPSTILSGVSHQEPQDLEKVAFTIGSFVETKFFFWPEDDMDCFEYSGEWYTGTVIGVTFNEDSRTYSVLYTDGTVTDAVPERHMRNTIMAALR